MHVTEKQIRYVLEVQIQALAGHFSKHTNFWSRPD